MTTLEIKQAILRGEITLERALGEVRAMILDYDERISRADINTDSFNFYTCRKAEDGDGKTMGDFLIFTGENEIDGNEAINLVLLEKELEKKHEEDRIGRIVENSPFIEIRKRVLGGETSKELAAKEARAILEEINYKFMNLDAKAFVLLVSSNPAQPADSATNAYYNAYISFTEKIKAIYEGKGRMDGEEDGNQGKPLNAMQTEITAFKESMKVYTGVFNKLGYNTQDIILLEKMANDAAPETIPIAPATIEPRPAGKIVWKWGKADLAWLYSSLLQQRAIDCSPSTFAAAFLTKDMSPMPASLLDYCKGEAPGKQGMKDIRAAILHHNPEETRN